MGVFEMVVIVVFLGTATGTIHKYLDSREKIAMASGRSSDKNVMGAIDELRAEIAALKKQDTEAVLSFDSTLQTLDTRVKHLERLALGEGLTSRTALGGTTAENAERLRASAS